MSEDLNQKIKIDDKNDEGKEDNEAKEEALSKNGSIENGDMQSGDFREKIEGLKVPVSVTSKIKLQESSDDAVSNS
jgi:hypothetical protein